MQRADPFVELFRCAVIVDDMIRTVTFALRRHLCRHHRGRGRVREATIARQPLLLLAAPAMVLLHASCIEASTCWPWPVLSR